MFSLQQASAIMLGFDPVYLDSVRFSNNEKGITVDLLRDVLNELALNGTFEKIEIDCDINGYERVNKINADELKIWALSNGYQWLSSNNTATNNDEFQSQLTAKDEEIARLKEEIESLKQVKTEQAQIADYEGEIPPQTDRDKLAHFIKLIIQKSEFMKDGRMPTYSQLHTMLSHKYPNEPIPSKNTLNKYLNP